MDLIKVIAEGQRKLDSMKGEINSLFGIVNWFLFTIWSSGGCSTQEILEGPAIDVENHFSVWIYSGSLMILCNGKKIRSADELPLSYIQLVHDRISEGVERLIEARGLSQKFSEFLKLVPQDGSQAIVVTPVDKPGANFHARLESRQGVWGSGKSQSEAIGDLVQSNPDLFNLTICNGEIYRAEE